MYHKPINHPLPYWNIIVLTNFFYSALINHLFYLSGLWSPSILRHKLRKLRCYPAVRHLKVKQKLIALKLSIFTATWSSKSWGNPWKYFFSMIIFHNFNLSVIDSLLWSSFHREACRRECEKSDECEYFRLVPSHSPEGWRIISLFYLVTLYTRLCFFTRNKIFYSLYFEMIQIL